MELKKIKVLSHSIQVAKRGSRFIPNNPLGLQDNNDHQSITGEGFFLIVALAEGGTVVVIEG